MYTMFKRPPVFACFFFYYGLYKKTLTHKDAQRHTKAPM